MRYRLTRFECFGDRAASEWDIMEFYENLEEAQQAFENTAYPEGWEVMLVDMISGTLLSWKS